MKKALISFVAVCAASLTIGCGDKNQTPKSVPSISGATNSESVNEVLKTAVASALPKGDRATPDNAFIEINSGKQVMMAYLAFAKLPIDYKKVAEDYSPEFSNALDEFRKNDLLKALQPRIDSDVKVAESQRYVKLSFDAALKGYDFDSKGFPLYSIPWDGDGYTYFSDAQTYRVSYSNGGNFKSVVVPDEVLARKMEEMRSKFQSFNFVVYAFIQDADVGNNALKVEILRIDVLDRNDRKLVTMQ